MRNLALAVLLFAVPSQAACPVSVMCPQDGQAMTLEQTYNNGGHMSQKWSHIYRGIAGESREYHSTIVSCD